MANAADLLNLWLEKVEDEELLEELRGMRDAGDERAVNDAFFQDLEFGTAGLRGIIGAGTNRMNIYTAGRATQGFANYLNANFENPSVAIARDSRNKGELFVQVAASVLAANGVATHVYPRIEPTPALSWAVRDLGCSGGICMTASHNPAPYNGYKAYGPDGCQITTEAARAISEAIAQVDLFTDVKTMSFDEALASGLVSWIGEDTLDRYIDAVEAQSLEAVGAVALEVADCGAAATAADASTVGADSDECGCDKSSERGEGTCLAANAGVADVDGGSVVASVASAAAIEGLAADSAGSLKLVYTPLNGTGLECVGRILERVGVTDVTVVPEQAQPDGNFPTCPYPNPEIREALQKGIELSEQVGPDLLLATDPDADRVGIAVKDGDDFALLSGNEVGVLLLDYVARKRLERGESLENAVAVTTIVSSAMVDALAAEYGFELRRVLTGFKYIGEVIGRLEAAGEAERFIFGFEESYGYLSGPHVRDKDAVNASMLICQMAQDCKRCGMSLAEAMRALYEKHGYYRNKTVSLEYPGAEGSARMASIMASVRELAASARFGGAMPADRVTSGDRTAAASFGGGETVAAPSSNEAFVFDGTAACASVPASASASVPALASALASVVEPFKLGRFEVSGVVDYGPGVNGLPAANVVQFDFADGSKLIVRPSGTEPKIKLYLFSKGATDEAAFATLAELEQVGRRLLA